MAGFENRGRGSRPNRGVQPVEQQPIQKPMDKPIDTDGLVNLTFLPKEYRERIKEIFDGFFGLGMKPSYWDYIDERTPQFPNKVASLSSPELGDTLGHYTAWYAFASDKRKYVAVACNFMEQELNKAQNEILGTLVSEKGNIEAKKAQAKSDPSYLVILDYYQRLSGMKILLDSEMESYDKCIFTLSREINRRENNAGF